MKKKIRKITIGDRTYTWNTFRPNGDGDGGIGLKIYANKSVILQKWLTGSTKPDAITPKFIANLIKTEFYN